MICNVVEDPTKTRRSGQAVDRKTMLLWKMENKGRQGFLEGKIVTGKGTLNEFMS
jgi:hypothetical protein